MTDSLSPSVGDELRNVLDELEDTLHDRRLGESQRHSAVLLLQRIKGMLQPELRAQGAISGGLCIGLMMDGDARTLGERYWRQDKRDIRAIAHANPAQWAADLSDIYADNANWLLEFVLALGEADQARGTASTAVVFITNQDNQRRAGGTNEAIMNAVLSVGMRWPAALAEAGIDFYVGGDAETVRRVIRHADDQGLVIQPLERYERKPNRTAAICLLGYQANVLKGFDPAVYRIPDMDIFLRSTHMRLSDMWVPAMKQTLFWATELNMGYYNPKDILAVVLEERAAREQGRHDACNTYEDGVYAQWHPHTTQPEGFLFVSRESLPSGSISLPLRQLSADGLPLFNQA